MNIDIERIYKDIAKLSENEKKIILSKLLSEINLTEQKNKNDIYCIKGVGKEIWDGIDAQDYVNDERSSWES